MESSYLPLVDKGFLGMRMIDLSRTLSFYLALTNAAFGANVKMPSQAAMTQEGILFRAE
jgi:hypothetical protein